MKATKAPGIVRDGSARDLEGIAGSDARVPTPIGNVMLAGIRQRLEELRERQRA